jgi:signal transduction histidine kinase/ligand-binding sensor domain-containing protein
MIAEFSRQLGRRLRRAAALSAAVLAACAGGSSRADDQPGAVFAPTCSCPRDYSTTLWLTDDGLPHNVVNRIRQDGNGFLWLATAAGLTRFDGAEFETFPLPADVTPAGFNVRDLVVAGTDSILLLPPQGGVLQFEGGEFRRHPISAVLTGKVADLHVEPGGAIWAGTFEGQLVRWHDGQPEVFGVEQGIARRGLGFYFATDEVGRTWIAAANFLGYYERGRLVRTQAISGAMLQIARAHDGLWVLVDGRLYKLRDGRAEPVALEPPWLPLKTSVRTFLEDSRGTLWLGTARQGLFRYHCGRIDAVDFAHQGVLGLAEDHEGSLWVATDGRGIGRIRPKVFQLFDHAAGFPEALSTSVCSDSRGDLWFANRAGGLVRMHGSAIKAYPYPDGANPMFVSSVCYDGAQHLWVGTTVGFYRTSLDAPTMLEKVNTTLRNPRVLQRTRDGTIWAATAGNWLGFFHGNQETVFTTADGFGGEGINAIAEDGAGDVWCGGASPVLYRWHAQKLTRLTPADGLAPAPIHALFPDASGALWIGCLNGLVVYDRGRFFHFTPAHGIPAGMILQIQEDTQGRLWLGGSSSLMHVRKDQLLAVARGTLARAAVVVHGRDEGLSGISPTTDYQPSTCRDAIGRLWFTTYKGALAVDPAAVAENTVPPPVWIKRVLLDEQPLDPRVAATIAPGAHELQFAFAALSYAAPARVKLRHRVEGVDARWVDTTESRTARYSNLPPGRYRLQVTACNGDGVWNERGAMFAFVIRPHFWETGWFTAMSGLTFTGLIVWGARHWTQRRLARRLERLERERALDQERSRIARDLHDELGASITSIGMLVSRLGRVDRGDATPVLEQLTGRTRRLASDLERVVWTVSPRNNSLDRLATFIGRYAHNFFRDSGVVCLVRGQRAVPAVKVAPDVQHHVLAVAKEAMNNALKHANATEVIVECAVRDERFTVCIRDNGNGFDPAAIANGERNGLPNMRSRMTEIGGELHIESTPGQGCTVRFYMPINLQALPSP